MRSLPGFCALINHFIAPPHLHCPRECATKCTAIAQHTPSTRPPFCRLDGLTRRVNPNPWVNPGLDTIQYWQWEYCLEAKVSHAVYPSGISG